MELHSVVPRACNNCRARKIRCNREYPCSNCLTSNIACQPGSRLGRGAAAALPTVESNPNSFKLLHERLERVESALRNLSAAKPSSDQPSYSYGVTTSPTSVPAQVGEPAGGLNPHERAWSDTPTCVKREPSFERQTYMATQIPELSVSEAASSPTLTSYLRTLKDAVNPPNEGNPRIGRALASPSIHMGRIPADVVLQLIRVLNTSRSLLVILHPIPDLELLKTLCQKVYFPVDPVSIGDLTLLNGMLFYALWEMQLRNDHDFDPQDIAGYKSICEVNFRAGVESAEIAAVATYEHTLALNLAAYYAQTRGDLARQQAFITVAARHCILLGYHRHDRGQYSPEDAEKYRQLFWHTYVSDLSLILRLGCAPVIEDYTVDAPLPAMSKDPRELCWDQALRAFIQLSRIQARVYRKLYSPGAAASSSAADRKRHVADLEARLAKWYDEWLQIDSTDAYYSHVYRAIFMPVDVVYYSALTLLHRGSTSSNLPVHVSNECFTAARQALTAHLHIFPKVAVGGPEAVSYYGVWILMYSSFTPFAVTFLHCVANSDISNLHLLQSVLVTLEEIATSYECLQRQYSLCKALYRVAEEVLQSRRNQGDVHAAPSNKRVNLPLQPTFSEDWDIFHALVEDWDGQYVYQQSLTLDTSLD